jgi:hypothetical protein
MKSALPRLRVTTRLTQGHNFTGAFQVEQWLKLLPASHLSLPHVHISWEAVARYFGP